MREIKFRAIEQKNGKSIWRYGSYAHTVMYPTSFRGHYVDDTQIDENTLGQYTGLKDKNSVEIYEGDILLVDESGRFGGLYNIAVEWVDWHDKNVIGGEKGHHWAFFGCVCLKAKEITNYNPSTNTIFTRGFLTRKYGSCIELSDMTRNDSFSIEVIGNIHQNPELLK